MTVSGRITLPVISLIWSILKRTSNAHNTLRLMRIRP